MLVIGERINGMFDEVGHAIAEQDADVIQDVARKQLEAGADVLDVNVGPASADEETAMAWLVETIREVTDAPLSIDSTKPPVTRAGLNACSENIIINSTTGVPAKMEEMLPLAAEYDCQIIGLCINEDGVPRDADGRLEIGMHLLAGCMEHGIPTDRLFIDPVILPVNALPQVPTEVCRAIGMVSSLSDPPPKTVIGLSNVSQGATQRSLLNRTFLVMALAYGLDAAIMDAYDTEMMEAMIAAEVLLNKEVYCDDFVQAYMARG
ncbi:MAG: dihydropteroate synthase [Armatimonadota bacterium]